MRVPRPASRSPAAVGFLFDENMAHRLARAFRAAGYCCWSVKGVGLGGASDPQVLEFCQRHDLILVSKDKRMLTNPIYASKVKSLRGFVVVKSPRARSRSLKEDFEVLARRMRELEQRYTSSSQVQLELRANGRLIRLT